MPGRFNALTPALGLALFVFVLGGCASKLSLPTLESASLGPTRPLTPGSVPANELVDAAGNCPGAPADGQPVLGGIGLGMTECTVVRRAGVPTRVEFPPDPSGQRAVVLTYLTGDRAGIYRFSAGRLKAIERVAPPPAPEPQVRQRRPRRR